MECYLKNNLFLADRIKYVINKLGITDLPLHYGKAPNWLLNKMIKISYEFLDYFLNIHNTKELINCLSNPYWFQAYSCFIGFDWHSSGTTTTTCYAIKKALKELGKGIELFGGKAEHMLKTYDEMKEFCERYNLNQQHFFYLSKKIAKADNTLLQDNYSLYHHCFILNDKKEWAIIQQGLNHRNSYARRYHWNYISHDNFLIDEPHSGIDSKNFESFCVNLMSKKSTENNKISLELFKEIVNNNEEVVISRIKRALFKYKQTTLFDDNDSKASQQKKILYLFMPCEH
ncbi:MAG: DUF763 domain-containing protein, partial [Candidatus Micrarchaeota archaeon]|nr:DUF763 domain-containing protein [Candidatus Micrarchaeota archaeon]